MEQAFNIIIDDLNKMSKYAGKLVRHTPEPEKTVSHEQQRLCYSPIGAARALKKNF